VPPHAPTWLNRALQLHVAALAVLGAIFVGSRHEAATLPAVAAIAAVVAFLVTDVLGLIKINRWLGSGIILLAVVWSLREFVRISPEEKLMAIASMLCYLQMVLLFQEKDARIFWQLIVLSTLEVVVGSALDLGPQYGVLLAIYAVMALSALILLCLYREFHEPATKPRDVPEKTQPTWSVLLGRPEISIAPPNFAASLTPALLIRQTAVLAAVTLLFAVVFFYSTPRLSEAAWLGGLSGRNGIAGFRPEVRLDQRGRLHLSSQVVMRVALTKIFPERRSIELISEPYFHGALLTEYKPDEAGGRWLPWRPSVASPDRPRERLGSMMRAPPQTTISLVREDIVMEASTAGLRFAIMPTQPYSEMLTMAYGGTTPREGDYNAPARQQRYSVATPAIINDQQVHGIPNPNRLLSLSDGVAFGEEEERALAIDMSRFPRLVETAADVIQQHELTDGTSLNKALALERHFLATGAYHYSLNLDFPRDPALDPIEDFVANHRTGSCQHFASTLALMLRSQRIPARLVVGYKGGTFNSVGRYYVVEQRHAHSWVEAWVPNEEVPSAEFAGAPSDGGVWYRLDPTPGREQYVTISKETFSTHVAQAFDYVELLWRDYVLSLNKNRQDEFVYDPLTARAAIIPAWIEPRAFQRWLRQLSRQLGFDWAPSSRDHGGRRAFEASVAILVTGGLIILLIVAQGLRLTWRAIHRWRSRHIALANASSHAPSFYRRLERVLARLPVVRTSGQTPRELAAAAEAHLLNLQGAALAAKVPADLVTVYYRVRFGGCRLDKNELQAIEQALAALNAAVRQKNAQLTHSR
jgi:protein-glutamine gamma-glutamyltransferase